MNAHRKTALHKAITCAGMLAVADAASAVQMSGDGRGQVLLYPYYTTRADAAGNAYATLFSVVNPTALAKAVNVKFSEGKDSRQVFELNLFLSPFDVWTAAILPDTTTGGAKIGTFDVSCTLPPFSASPTAPFYSFVNSAYAGPSDDGAGATLDRTREGHFEIIEMATYASSSTTGKAVTHVNGVPPCGANLTDARAALDALPLTGGLYGAATYINVNSGTEYAVDAVALANFYLVGSNYNPIGTSLPDLTQASPPRSSIFTPNGSLYETIWGGGNADAVSAVLMRDAVLNEYTLDTSTKSGTDWVLTMPTKRYYVNRGTGNATKLFQRNFNGTAGSCDDVTLSIWDREERAMASTPTAPICWASTVMTFNNTNVLGSTNSVNVPPPFQNGWVNAAIPATIGGASPTVHRLISAGATTISGNGLGSTTGHTVTYFGLPVIGFAVISFRNGTLQAGTPPAPVLSNYGGNFVHKTNTNIQ